jgi:4'-phosphopantetheinyl transferase EntD
LASKIDELVMDAELPSPSLPAGVSGIELVGLARRHHRIDEQSLREHIAGRDQYENQSEQKRKTAQGVQRPCAKRALLRKTKVLGGPALKRLQHSWPNAGHTQASSQGLENVYSVYMTHRRHR